MAKFLVVPKEAGKWQIDIPGETWSKEKRVLEWVISLEYLDLDLEVEAGGDLGVRENELSVWDANYWRNSDCGYNQGSGVT